MPDELVILVKTFGPIVGLMIFMVWKQLQLSASKPQIDAIAARVETIEDLLRTFEAKLDLMNQRLLKLRTIDRKVTTLLGGESNDKQPPE